MAWDKTGNIRGPAGADGAGGSGVITKQVPANQPFTAVAAAAITGLSIPVAAGEAGEFELMMDVRSAALTTGWLLGFTGPAMARFSAVDEYETSATAWAKRRLDALGSFPVVTAAWRINADITIRTKGTFLVGAAAGTFQVVFATEVANSAVTVMAGSVLKYV